jgi:hypothetical protein
LLVPAFAVALLGSTKIAKAQEYYGPRQYYYQQREAERAWERQGFYDGGEALTEILRTAVNRM